MMRYFKVVMETPYAGQVEDEYFEVPDDTTEEEIAEIAKDIFFNYFNYGYTEITEEESEGEQ